MQYVGLKTIFTRLVCNNRDSLCLLKYGMHENLFSISHFHTKLTYSAISHNTNMQKVLIITKDSPVCSEYRNRCWDSDEYQ